MLGATGRQLAAGLPRAACHLGCVLLPGAVRKAANTAKQAWLAFKQENWVQETGIGLSDMQPKDINISVFDQFMKAHTARPDDVCASRVKICYEFVS